MTSSPPPEPLLLLAAQILPLLSLIYSLAVHAFLSNFNERSFLKLHHWIPILTRASFCCAAVAVITIFYSSSYVDDDDDYSSTTLLNTVLSGVIIAVAIKFIVSTRQVEINGPPPPNYYNNAGLSSLQNKIILITGANSGIGLETARILYHKYNATVVLACRSRSRAVDAMRSIDPAWQSTSYNSSSGSITGKRMYFIPIDLSSMQSIRDGVKIFLEMDLPLHVLVNNAGVMMNDRLESVDGLEMTMAANHLGHFLLGNLLLPKLRQTAIKEKHPSKVITVSSSLYTNAVRPSSNNDGNEAGIDLQDLQCNNKPYRLFEQYAQSKLANILFARELHKREQLSRGLIQSYALHPGLVRTNVTRNMPWYLYYPNLVFSLFVMMLQKSPESGAYTTVHCVVSDDDVIDDSCYYVNSQKQPLEKLALNDNDARKLWKLSCQLVSLPLEKES